MIAIDTLEAEGFGGEFYKLHFRRLGFLLFPSPNLDQLHHFSKTQQRRLGKIKIHFNLTSILKFPQFFKDVDYILLTDFNQMLYLPFLTKLLPDVKVIVTNLAFQLGRISIETFQELLTDFDATTEDMEYFQESENLDKYQEDMDVMFQNWRDLYSQQDFKSMIKKVVKVNYHQIFDTNRGILLRCFPSGKNNGSCFWELKNIETHQKVLVINEIAQYKWKSCLPYSIERIQQSQKQDPYQLVIFTKKALDSYSQGQEIRIADIIKKINTNAHQGISTTIILEDNTFCIDLVPRLSVVPEGPIQGVILGHQSYHSMHNYVNSLVDFISQYYKDQIFKEIPDYPLAHYSKLRSKGYLVIGSLQELALKRKLPLKEIILQSHPFVRFITNYQYQLEIENRSLVQNLIKHNYQKVSLGNNFSNTLLEEFKEATGSAEHYCFSEGRSHIHKLSLGNRHSLVGNVKLPFFIQTKNSNHRIFQQFTTQDNELHLTATKHSFLKYPKKWAEILKTQLTSQGFKVLFQTPTNVKTEQSQVTLSQTYQLSVISRSAMEMQVIGRCLLTTGKKYQLP